MSVNFSVRKNTDNSVYNPIAFIHAHFIFDNGMGKVYAEIDLINGIDAGLAKKNLIGEEEVKRIGVKSLVDTGAITLCINENIQEYLQLPVVDTRVFHLADGKSIECKVVAPVDVLFKNRLTTCRAVVLPGDSEVLLGLIPIEEMDVLIDPVRQELIVHPERPDIPMGILKGLREIKKDR